jgi:hypothetical protein
MYVDSENKARVNNLVPGYPDGSVELEEKGSDIGFMGGWVWFPCWAFPPISDIRRCEDIV